MEDSSAGAKHLLRQLDDQVAAEQQQRARARYRYPVPLYPVVAPEQDAGAADAASGAELQREQHRQRHQRIDHAGSGAGEDQRDGREQEPQVIVVAGEAQRAAEQQEGDDRLAALRSEEHTSELQSLMRISYAVFYLTK